MKIIDLLNKIANGEEVPKEIFYKKQWWEYNPDNDYEGTDWGGCFLNNVLICDLNDEVEIIEKDEEIKKIKNTINYYINYEDERLNEDISCICHHLISHTDKINELIDAVNELKQDK